MFGAIYPKMRCEKTIKLKGYVGPRFPQLFGALSMSSNQEYDVHVRERNDKADVSSLDTDIF